MALGQFRLLRAKIEHSERNVGPVPSRHFGDAEELEQGRFEREPALFQIIHVIRPQGRTINTQVLDQSIASKKYIRIYCNIAQFIRRDVGTTIRALTQD